MSMRDFDDPYGGRLTLREAMNRLLEDSFVVGGARGAVGALQMPLDVFETRDAVVVRTSMPGVRPDDIDITVTGDTLTIRGELQDQPPAREGRYHLREHRAGSFARSLTLPIEVQPDKVQATFEHGVLTLHMPKAERMRPKSIKITTSGGASPIGARGNESPIIEGSAAQAQTQAPGGKAEDTTGAAAKRSRKKSE